MVVLAPVLMEMVVPVPMEAHLPKSLMETAAVTAPVLTEVSRLQSLVSKNG
jgi:hypothetical protein